MKQNTAVLSLLAVGAIGLSSIAPAQVTRQGNGYTLRVKYQTGQTIKYTLANSMVTPGAKSPAPAMSIPMTIRVVSVTKGVATLEASIGPVPGQGKPQTQQMKMDSRGRVVGGPAAGLQSLSGVAMPDKAVTVGQTWKDTAQVPSPMGPISTTTSYKFLGIRTVGGKSVAELSMSMSGKGSSLSMNGSGRLQILVSDGTLYGMTMTQKAMLPGNMGGPAGGKTPSKPMTFDTLVKITRN